jgi:hypothetical protein
MKVRSRKDMTMTCDEIREMLPAYAERGAATLAVRRHLARCPDCRAELTRYTALSSALSDLKHNLSEPPASVMRAIEAIPRDTNTVDDMLTHVLRNKNAYLGGLAVAAVGATGAALWRRRRLATA